jgi:mannose-6-phosphate isomerase class I
MIGCPYIPCGSNPIYQDWLWGGRRLALAGLLTAPLPSRGPIGEAWGLSYRDDYRSPVANGPLKGQSIAQLLEHSSAELLGGLAQMVGAGMGRPRRM